MEGKETLTWEEFLNACTTMEKLSENLDQSWKLEGNSEDVGGCYLKYSCIKPIAEVIATAVETESGKVGATASSGLCEASEEDVEKELTSSSHNPSSLVKCEYHIVFNSSYSVPVLFFNISRSDGSLLKLDEVWSIFLGKKGSKEEDVDMWSTLSQQDHPVLNVPYFTMHPCHTGSVMKTLWNNPKNSSLSYLITWLSLVGGKLGLNLANEFGKLLTQPELEIEKR